jgi:hypothetical protein
MGWLFDFFGTQLERCILQEGVLLLGVVVSQPTFCIQNLRWTENDSKRRQINDPKLGFLVSERA